MSYRLNLALLLALPLAACAEPVAPTAAPVDFAYPLQRLQTEPAFVVTENDGEVSVRGYLRTPCLGYDARVEAERSGSTLKVRIVAINPGICATAIGTYGYQATLRGVPAGEYQLRVEHVYPQTGWPTTVPVDTQVRVP